MPKVHKRVARKDYPKFGIVKGQSHYQWTLKTGPRSSQEFRQASPPRRSQLTSSEYLGTLYGLCDRIEEAEDADALRDLAQELRELGEEQDAKFENMPEGLQQGDTGQTLESRASACSEAADEIESAADELGEALDEIDTRLDAWTKYREAQFDNGGEEPEGEEPEGEEIDADDAQRERSDALDVARETAGNAAGNCDQ